MSALLTGPGLLTSPSLLTGGTADDPTDGGDGLITAPDAGTAPGPLTYPGDPGTVPTPPLNPVPEPANLPPRIRIDITGLAGTTVTLTRHDSDGGLNVVRGASDADLIGGAATFYDYEPAYNRSVYYDAVSDTGASLTSAYVTLAVTQAWLIHPFLPNLSVPLYSYTRVDEQLPTGLVYNYVPGRSDPIPVGDGARQTAQGGFGCRTLDEAGTAAMRAILNNTDSLLLQIVYPFTTASTYLWIGAGQETVGDVSKQFGDPRRKFTVPYTVVARPAGTIQAQWTWADVLAIGTWRDVFNTFATWQGVMTGVPGT